jgi:molecular chaperone DnaJ
VWQVLGVAKDAPSGDIKKAYYKVAKQYHPDQNPGDKQAELKFLEAQKAYETLADGQKRNIYDQVRYHISLPISYTK